MSTTELDPGAGAAAPETEQTALPEQQTAEVAQQQNDAGEGSDQSKEPGEQADKLTPEQRTIKKLESRIARLAGKRGAAEERARLLEQQFEALQRASRQEEGNVEQPGSRTLTEADIDRMAHQRAKEIAQWQAFQDRVGRLIDEGKKLDGFSEAIDALDEILPVARNKQPTPFLLAVVDAVEGHEMQVKVLKHLGDNPDEAEQLVGLNPAQLGRRLAKLEDRLTQSAKAKTSSAPRPLQPLSARNAGFSSPRTPEDLLNELRSMRR